MSKFFAAAYTDKITIAREGGQDLRDIPLPLAYHARDLLEALRDLLAYQAGIEPCRYQDGGESLEIQRARAALAKAEGK